MQVLATGGAGYIGAHVAVELLAAGHEVVVLDNLCNSRRSAIDRIMQAAGRKVTFVEGDVRDTALVRRTLEGHGIDAVIHLAGLKAVGESVTQPLEYYDVNVGGSVSLLRAMRDAGVGKLVFSSSATVYGEPSSLPLREDAALRPVNPYGHSKMMVEQVIRDAAAADASLSAYILRYFNPVGAHPSGLIGEDPCGIPNNLLPYVTRVAAGRLECLSIFGNDWPTTDGTGMRDYLHVVDLAQGHLAALAHCSPGAHTCNLGTGQASSVLDVVRAMERASGNVVPFRFAPRRHGDIAAAWADPAAAHRLLGWHARYDLDQACIDAWRWQQRNPEGYPGDP